MFTSKRHVNSDTQCRRMGDSPALDINSVVKFLEQNNGINVAASPVSCHMVPVIKTREGTTVSEVANTLLEKRRELTRDLLVCNDRVLIIGFEPTEGTIFCKVMNPY